MKTGLLAFFTGVIVTALLLLAFGSRLWKLAAVASNSGDSHAVTYADFLTVTLTALCALLAAMAIAIGIAAVVGYHDLKSSAERIATEKAEKAAAHKAEAAIAEWTGRFSAIEQEMQAKANVANKLSADLLALLSGEPGAKSGVARASTSKQNIEKKAAPPRYPKKEI